MQNVAEAVAFANASPKAKQPWRVTSVIASSCRRPREALQREAVKPYDQNGLRIVTFEAMFNGYVDALARFDTAIRTTDPAATFVPLFEALNWAVALDQRTRDHFVPDGKPIGYGWPARIGHGAEIIGGVRFARNSIHHQWSDALDFRGGAQLPRTEVVRDLVEL
jgi:hypothetical protein